MPVFSLVSPSLLPYGWEDHDSESVELRIKIVLQLRRRLGQLAFGRQVYQAALSESGSAEVVVVGERMPLDSLGCWLREAFLF